MYLDRMTCAAACVWLAFRFVQVVSIPIAKVNASAPGVAYVAFQRNPEAGFPSSSFPCEMRFKAADCDPETGELDGEGFDDVFPLEQVELGTCEFMAKVPVPNFRAAWEAVGESGEVRICAMLSVAVRACLLCLCVWHSVTARACTRVWLCAGVRCVHIPSGYGCCAVGVKHVGCVASFLSFSLT